MAVYYAASVLLVVGLAGLCNGNGCSVTQPNCFAPPTNRAPFGSSAASDTCGVSGQFGVETFSFGGITNRPQFPRVDGLMCDANDQLNSHNVSDLNDVNNGTWWQAPYNSRDVTLRLDFANPLNLLTIEIEHRSVRPSRALLEYSTDNGATWSIYQFYALQCGSRSSGFGDRNPRPRVVSERDLPMNSTEAVCIQEQSNSLPENRGVVSFDASARFGGSRYTEANIALLESYYIITNLRYSMTSLFTLSTVPIGERDTLESQRYYYGVYEWRVTTTCHCFGHSDTCVPAPGDTNGLNSGCVCDHNTMGMNCELCRPLFNNRPWRPGTETEANNCEECTCNNHATSCTFNPSIGMGTCNNCTDNTVGNNCDMCAPNFFASSTVPVTDPNFCIDCACNSSGTVPNTTCNNNMTGMCVCRTNVINRQCDECRDGFFNLDANNRDGCQDCGCNEAGSTTAGLVCSKDAFGQCGCKSNVIGRACDMCMDGFFNLTASNPMGCQPCNCDCGGSTNPVCDKMTGECMCWPFVQGRTCNAPVMNYYFPDFDWLLAEAEDFVQPVGSELNLMINPFPAGGMFTGEGVVNYAMAGGVAVYERPTRPIAIPAEYNSVRCRTMPANIVSTALNATHISYTVLAPGSVDSCFIVPDVSGTCVAGQNLTDCVNRVNELALPDPACAGVTFSAVTDIFNRTLPCMCDNTGSVSVTCVAYGGQCPCRSGIQGRTCDECMPGFYQFSNAGCLACECDALGSFGPVCDRTSGICNCRSNIVGRTCDACRPNFFDFGNAAGCRDCECNASFSANLQCNDTGVCTCLPGVGGDKCTECLPGFHSITAGVGCTPCGCDVNGTQTDRTCDPLTGMCPCKANVIGTNCDQCRIGTFGLSSLAPDGCWDCVCSGKPAGEIPSCTSADGYRLNSIAANFTNGIDGFGATDPAAVLSSFLADATNRDALLLNYQGPTTENPSVFFTVPLRFRNDLESSLGHFLSLSIETTTFILNGQLPTRINGTVGTVVIGTDLPGVANIVAALPGPAAPFASEIRNISIRLYPTDGIWRVGTHLGPAASLRQIREVLQRVTLFNIRAVPYFDVPPIPNVFALTRTILHTFSIERAVLSDDIALPEVRSVESCSCPAAYTGPSCERCNVSLFTRNFDIRSISLTTPVNAFDTCVTCACNSHSVSCEEVSGICINCQDNTIGSHCEECADTFFGDATVGTRNSCFPCNCNETGSVNGICNKADGICSCQPNIVDRLCDRCADTFFQFSSSGCIECACNTNATVASTCTGSDCICDQRDGQCLCQPNVEGRQCTQCEFGTFGVAPSCTVCHECFLQWFNLIQVLSQRVEEQDNRTTEALLRAFGNLTASDVRTTLDNIRNKLEESRTRIDFRQDAILEAQLIILEQIYSRANLNFLRVSRDIDETAESLAISISRFPFIQAFNGTVRVFDGGAITSSELTLLSSEQNIQISNITRVANSERLLLEDAERNATASVTSAQDSKAIVAAALTSARATLNDVATAQAQQSEYAALYQSNRNYINALSGTVSTLEADTLNASMLISTAYTAVRAANVTAYMARVQALGRIGEARQLLMDVQAVQSLAMVTYQSAANVSRVSNTVQANAQRAYMSVRMTLDELTQINGTLNTLAADLNQARNAAQMVLDLQTPSALQVDEIFRLAQQINASIVPQELIAATLRDAESALAEAMEIVAVTRAAYNASRIALDMVTEIQSVLNDVANVTGDVTDVITRATADFNEANSTLQVLLQTLAETEAVAALRLNMINGVIIPNLQATETCQNTVSQQLTNLFGRTYLICNTVPQTANQAIATATANATSVDGLADGRLATANQLASQETTTRAEADNLRRALDGPPNLSIVTGLLTDYIQLQMDIQSAQARAMRLESEVNTAITDFQLLSSRCQGSIAN